MKKGKGVLWFLYVCVLGLGFARTTASMTRMMGWPVTAYFLLTAALIIAALLFFYLPGKLLAGKFGSGAKKGVGRCFPKARSRKLRVCSWLLGGLLLEALVCVRLFWMPDIGNAAEQAGLQRAMAALGKKPSGLFLNDLYPWLLSVLFSAFGESASVFFGNLIFQAAGFGFLYIGIYLLAGGICACSTLVLAICLPVFHNSTYMAEPQSLLLFFLGAAVWLCALCDRAVEKRAVRSGRLPAHPALIAGVCCGIAGAVHPLLCSLLFLFPQRALARCRKAGTMRLLLLFFLSAAGSFFLILCADSFLCGQGVLLSVERWLKEGLSREYDAILHSPSLMDWWLTLPAYLLAFLAVFGVLEKDGTKGVEWVLPFLSVMAAELAGETPLQEQGIRFVLLGVMAGLGIGQTVSVPAQEESEGAAGAQEIVEELDRSAEEGGGEEMAEQNDRFQENKTENRKKAQEAPAPGSWLENPLPVPKRHVKKEMDYGFEPDPDQMFFDIPVSDQDDFDI